MVTGKTPRLLFGALVSSLAVGACVNALPTAHPDAGEPASTEAGMADDGENGDADPTAEADAGAADGAAGTVRPLECTRSATTARLLNEALMGHAVRVDVRGRLLSWLEGDAPYPRIAARAFDALNRVPVQPDGFPTYYGDATFLPAPAEFAPGHYLSHNIAGLTAMLIDSALAYSAYAADPAPVTLVRALADHVIAVGLSDADGAWPGVPFATGDPGATSYRGSSYIEGVGVLEPDKVGELGYALLRLYQTTGDASYRDVALACANALAANVRPGDDTHSPWPFRVEAKSGAIHEEYTADVIGPIALFDRAMALGLGDPASLGAARSAAWEWLLRYPLTNARWTAYFEDIGEYPLDANRNQYVPLETARYMMEHPELDLAWRVHTSTIIDFVTRTFTADVQVRLGPELGHQYGAEVISEQEADVSKMGSHTARFAAVLALWAEKTGDSAALERAFRSFNWATYTSSRSGVVRVGQNDDEGFWFSDGYGDYVRHFFRGLGSVPDWAPCGESHLLRSSSEVQSSTRSADAIRYRVADAASVEVFRLPHPPRSIELPDGTPAPEVNAVVEALAPGDVAVHLERRGARELVIRF
jgi:hypothetical protein